MSRNLAPIIRPYLLCTNVRCYRDGVGRRYVDPLWHKDLAEHLGYVSDLTLACPSRDTDMTTGLVPLDVELGKVKVIDLPDTTNIAAAIQCLPITASRLWSAIDQADIVHTGLSSWPISLAWIAIPIARLKRKFCFIVVENSDWRLTDAKVATVKLRLKAVVGEVLNRWCVNHSELTVFTHEQYLADLMSRHRSNGYVIPASWINDDDIVSENEARLVWDRKKLDLRDELRLVFIGQLSENKGVLRLLDAVRRLAATNLPINLDIVGSGTIEPQARAVAACVASPAHVRFITRVPYGRELFQLIRTYHAVVIPSISDEQPRVIFDAYSQAVPVLATDTAGLRAWVSHGVTGLLAASNDAGGIANLLSLAFECRDALPRMGLACLPLARRWTHRRMHRKRWQLLTQALQDWDLVGPAARSG